MDNLAPQTPVSNPAPELPSPIEFTIAEASAGCPPYSKSYRIDDAGEIVSSGRSGKPTSGTMTRRTLSGSPAGILQRIGAELETLSCRQALILAPPLRVGDEHRFVTKDNLAANPGAIARSKEHFKPIAGPMLFGVDFDLKAWPAAYRERVGSRLDEVLLAAFPGFEQAVSLRRPSGSAGMRNRETGELSGADAGLHWLYLVRDGTDIVRFSEALDQRLVLAGFGYAVIFGSGTVEVRSPIDRAVSPDVSRLWFEGAAVLNDDRLEFVPGGRACSLARPNGSLLDTRRLPSLSPEEQDRYLAICAELRAGVAIEAAEQLERWRAKRMADLTAKGASADKARAMLFALRERRQLPSDFLVEFDDGSAATVAEILADPHAFHGMTCPDPLEPDYGSGRNLAVCYSASYPPTFWSHAHGGIRYILTPDVSAFFEQQAEQAPAGATPVVAGLFSDDDDIPLASRVPHDLFGHADPGDLASPPAGSMPYTLERFVRTEARRKSVPEAFPAAAALTAVAAAVGNSLRLQVRQHDTGWTEPSGLWSMLIAPPGSTKSPTITEAVRPIHDLDKAFRREWKPIHDEWERMAKAKRSGRKDAPDPGPEPICPRRSLDNFTTERAIQICSVNPRGLIVTPDELSSFLGGVGAYKKSGEGDRAQMLRFFDGGSVTVDRVGSGNLYAESALLSILAGVQPDKLATLTAGLGVDGMLQRFLPILHDGKERPEIDERPDDAGLAGYASMIRTLSTAEYVYPAPIRLSPEAGALLAAGIADIKLLKNLPNLGTEFGGHLEKWGKLAPRIVLAFHAVTEIECHGSVNPARRVAAETVVMAMRFAHFLLRHSLEFYDRFSAPTAGIELEVAGFLLSSPELKVVTRRDVYQGCRVLRGEENRRTLLKVMTDLEHANWVETLESAHDGATRWLINPSIHTRFVGHAARVLKEREEKRHRILEASAVRKAISGDTNDFDEQDVFG